MTIRKLEFIPDGLWNIQVRWGPTAKSWVETAPAGAWGAAFIGVEGVGLGFGGLTLYWQI